MQVPRPVGLMHFAHLLAQDAHFPRGGQPPQRTFRRRRQGHRGQRRPQLYSRRGDNQASRQGGPCLLRRHAVLLLPQQHVGVFGDPGARVQRNFARGGGLWYPLLRKRPEDRAANGDQELQV